MSQIVYALTSTSELEIRQSLRILRDSTDGTGFIHESYSKDDPKNYTRARFAWANTLFGELFARLATTRPEYLRPF
jgi:meiotically up-regulated gene 157 (Mug157) protein